jgi:FkbM family methyltransferase
MPNYYSQHGEDFLLDQLFKDKTEGVFVEVGCIDGRRFSNTLTFEDRGWRGLCIEAHSGYIEALKQNRPNSKICHCAAGEEDEDNVSFFANSRGSLSTLDKSKESYFLQKYGKYFTAFEEQHINKRRLDTLFDEHRLTEIDFISLDVEGYEANVLRGLDLKKYRPTVLVVESDDLNHESELDHLIIPNGYVKSLKLEQNIFYLDHPDLERRIKNKQFELEITHTKHPLDSGGDLHLKIHIDTRCRYRRALRTFTKLLSGKTKCSSEKDYYFITRNY